MQFGLVGDAPAEPQVEDDYRLAANGSTTNAPLAARR